MRSQSGGLVSAAILVAFLLLAACTATTSTTPSTPQAPAPTSPAGVAASPTPVKPTGSLVVEARYGAGQLDPQIGSDQQYSVLSGAILDPLVFRGPEDELLPGIAERWVIADDGLSHTFYIRKGVKFHDGSDLTGADVKFSIERMIAPESITVDAPVWRAAVSRVELKDDYTVVVQLKGPQYELLRGVASAMGAVMPKKYIEEKGVENFRRNPMGSGPWKFVKWDAGTRLDLQAVESHWRAVPKLKNLTILNIPEEATKVALLKTGELDMAMVAPDSVAGIKSAGLRVLTREGGGLYFGLLFWDVDNPGKYILGDVRVRKALQLAINQKEIADSILGGGGEPYALPFQSPKAFFWDANVLKPDPFDPEGAKKLLAEAGRPNGFDTRLYDVGGGGLQSTMDAAMAGYWRKIGVNAQIVPIDYSSFFAKMVPKQSPEIWDGTYSFLSGASTEFSYLTTLYHSTKGVFKNLKNPKLDEMLDRVPNIKDPAEKKRVAIETAVLAKSEYSALAIVAVNANLALGKKVGDLTARRGGVLTVFTYENVNHPK